MDLDLAGAARAVDRFLDTPGGGLVGLAVALALFALAVWLAHRLGVR